VKEGADKADFAILHKTSGGSIDTELKLLAVIPIGSSFKSLAVIIVTPVAKLDKAALNSLEEN
jgi:hypothetical protein